MVSSSSRSPTCSIISSKPSRASSEMFSGVPTFSRSLAQVLIAASASLSRHVGHRRRGRSVNRLVSSLQNSSSDASVGAPPPPQPTTDGADEHERCGEQSGPHELRHGVQPASSPSVVERRRERDPQRTAERSRGTPHAGSRRTPSVARCGVTHCTSSTRRSACSSRSRSTSPISATFEASRSRWNIDSPANTPPMLDAVQPARQPAVAPRLDRVHPAQLVQRDVGIADLAGDPAVRPLAVAARVDDLLERRVDPDLEVPCRPAQRLGDDQPVEGQHAAAYGREPAHRIAPSARRHREQPLRVGGEQGAGREVAAHRDEVVLGVPVGRLGEHPR